MSYLTCTEVYDAFTEWRLPFEMYPGWRALCRCHSGSHDQGGSQERPWYGNLGDTLHITAGVGRPAMTYTANVIVNDPVTPLKSNFVTTPETGEGGKFNGSKIIVVSCGRTNHILAVGQALYNALRSNTLPLAHTASLRGSGIQAKAYCRGWEQMAVTKAGPAQLELSLHGIAALQHAEGNDGRRVFGHGEGDLTRTPADPNENMGRVRQRCMALVAAGPTGSGTTPTPTPEDEPMKITKFDHRKEQALKPGVWNPVKFGPQAWSLASGSGFVQSQADITAKGLPKGAELQVRFYTVKTDAKGRTIKRSFTWAPSEIVGTAGNSFGQVSVLDAIGDTRLRVEAWTAAEGVSITRAFARTAREGK